MAFLCPARRKKNKIRIKGPRPLEAPAGRITGSTSIDTLVRVGLEKQRGGARTPMVVVHDFTPCVDDELAVRRNQLVHLLYQENDWMYVIAQDGREGFIPYTYCLPLQRSVDDFMVTKTKKKRGDEEQLIEPLDRGRDREGKGSRTLVRTASKSLPDISDIGTNSSKSTLEVPLRHPRNPSSHSTRPVSYTPGLENNAFRYSSHFHSTNNKSGHSSAVPEDVLLDTSAADLRLASAAVRVKQQQFLQSRKLSKSKEGYISESIRSPKSAPPSTLSTHLSNGALSDSKSSHSLHGHTTNHGSRQSLKHKTTANSFTSHQQTQPGTPKHHSSGSIGSNMLNKSWSGPAPSDPHQHFVGRSLNNTAPLYPGQYHSNRSYVSHPYAFSNSGYQQSERARSSVSQASTSSGPLARKFHKTLQGQYLVLFQFKAQQENDITVERGEFVTVLNKDDSDWYWVKRADGHEGFVPSNYVRRADSIPVQPLRASMRQASQPASHSSTVHNMLTHRSAPVAATPHYNGTSRSPLSPGTHHSPPHHHPVSSRAPSPPERAPRGATRLVCLYDFRARVADDLTVTRGEWLYADLSKQEDPDWLWVFSPSQTKSGYVPKTYAKAYTTTAKSGGDFSV